ncbi:MAG: potassium/proton antiporter, partial [Burkholderiales bacterium]|nr:potassium/proton antiporter [Burkholderiales bacterium]
MEYWNLAILVGALILLISIIASDISSRLGAPLLFVFLLLGMLAGEEGPGGIRFDDVERAYMIGTLALAVIIFDGGMRTRRETFRVALWPAVSLATLGVVITAVLVAMFAAWILKLHWLQGLLIGAIVGSTDAAAVFSLLRNAGLSLKQRVAATLEIESASNDPMAIFLTVTVIGLLAAGHSGFEAMVLLSLLQQFGIGAVLGLGGGRALVWLINRLTLASGLYPLLAVAGGLIIFAATAQLGGSGFLAIFMAGLVLGNSKLHSAQNILRVHDGLAWLSQIVMFVILGLLATPSDLISVAGPALAIAAFLMLVARPAAVMIGLLPFRLPWREQVFISWVGLRGAVPVVLALFPLIYGTAHARLYFNVAFFFVLVSLLLPGWTFAVAARWLRL